MKINTQKYIKDRAKPVIVKHKGDILLVLMCVGLMILGLVLVISISSGLAQVQNTESSKIILKSILYVLVSLVFLGFSALIGPKIFLKLSKLGLIIAVLLSIILFFVGDTINGAKRWLDFGVATLQVAEIIKIAVLFFFARFIGEQYIKNSPESNRSLLKITTILMGLVIFFVVILQKDLGSGVVILSMIFGITIFAGLNFKKIFLIIVPLLVVLFFSTILSPHRRERLTSYGNNNLTQCNDSNFQQCQAGIAIGSGGWTGRGLAGGVQAFGYLPESHNDAIFAVFAEKNGFIGVVLLLLVYYLIISRLYKIVVYTQNKMHAAIVSGTMIWISVQMSINVVGMLGLFALKGITLPFVSAGGTSVIILSSMLGFCFYISKYTNETVR